MSVNITRRCCRCTNPHLKQSLESLDNRQFHTSPGEFTEGGPAEEDIAHKRHRTESDMVLMDIETEEQEEE